MAVARAPNEIRVPTLGRGSKVYVGRADRSPDPTASHGLYTDDEERAIVVLASVRWTVEERAENLRRIAARFNALEGVANPLAVKALIKAARQVTAALSPAFTPGAALDREAMRSATNALMTIQLSLSALDTVPE